MTTSPTHRHTPNHSFICLTNAQSTTCTSPNPDRDELLKNIEELENGKKKLVEEQRKANEKNTFLMKKKLKVCATVIMKEISLATKDRT